MARKDILIIALNSPVLIGIYEGGELVKEISKEDKASDFLIDFLASLVQGGDEISSITYANTPGSFMGLKVSYQILKIFCEIRGVDFWAVSGFALNNGAPIKANSALCFIKNGDKIELKPATAAPFKLPQNITTLPRTKNTLPIYAIPAV